MPRQPHDVMIHHRPLSCSASTLPFLARPIGWIGIRYHDRRRRLRAIFKLYLTPLRRRSGLCVFSSLLLSLCLSRPSQQWRISFSRVVMMSSTIGATLFHTTKNVDDHVIKNWEEWDVGMPRLFELNILGIDIRIYMNEHMHSNGLYHRTAHIKRCSRPFCETMVRFVCSHKVILHAILLIKKRTYKSTTWSTT